jgi:hypothetical protein
MKSRLAAPLLLCALAAIAPPALGGGDGPPSGPGWRPLFNGNDLSGWELRDPNAKKVWVVCSDAKLDPANPARLVPEGPGGGPDAVLLCGGDGKGSDIMTSEHFDNYELYLEFTVPKGSNSGVYNRGLYEIQIFDSFGVEKLAFHDCGSLYERALPPRNLSRPPGMWQSYRITMKGPRISLVWNGEPVFTDRDVRYGETDRAAFDRLREESKSLPAELRVDLREEGGRYLGYFGLGGTRSGLPGADRPGPILLQGDHGPVAYRRLWIRPLEGSR